MTVAEKKVVRQRLSVLELAEALGNVSDEALQKDLDRYVRFYNTERPHQGYRNLGKRPVDTVEGFVKSSGKKAS